MRRLALMAVLLAGACAGSDPLDSRMKPLLGATEPALVAAMGRVPDSSSQAATGAKVLQWKWQKTYALPDRMLVYSYAGGTTRPIPNTPDGIVRDHCLAEWTVENGIATGYSVNGKDCAAVTSQLAAR